MKNPSSVPRANQPTPPQLVVLGGPNGAGKSSAYTQLEQLGFVIGPFLNPDNIARDLGGETATQHVRAARETLRLARRWIAEKRTFTRESTLTGNEVLRWMRGATEVGYRVVLVFVGVDNLQTSKSRVQNRVLHGGHDVEVSAQERRFARSFANARRATSIASTVYFVDNTHALNYVAWVEQGRVRFVDATHSRWLLPVLKGLPQDEPRAQALALARHQERLPRYWQRSDANHGAHRGTVS